jgi:hypothetical protein
VQDKYKAMYSIFLLCDGVVCQHEHNDIARETSYTIVGRSSDSDMSVRFWFYPSGLSDFACETRFRFTPVYSIDGRLVDYTRGMR